ncbi:hypothetical protein POP15_098 [Pectobacterium phage POP15]|nr:hypothetical protein POP15_098 [Pectobacterium phage POP15]
MSYKVGDRVRIDEGLTGEDDYPYTGVGRLVSKGNMTWKVDLEWLVCPAGEKIGGPGDTYTIYESEIAEVLND